MKFYGEAAASSQRNEPEPQAQVQEQDDSFLDDNVFIEAPPQQEANPEPVQEDQEVQDLEQNIANVVLRRPSNLGYSTAPVNDRVQVIF